MAVKSSSRIWKVVADAWTDSEVERLARRENRTLSNMVVTLCKRQLEAMRAQRGFDREHADLVATIRGSSEPAQ
jgi:hypothetical protein